MRAGVTRRGSKQQLFIISFFLSFDTVGLSFFISQSFIETFFHFFLGFLYSSLNSLMPIIYGVIQYTSVKNGNYDDFCLSITYLELWLMFIMCSCLWAYLWYNIILLLSNGKFYMARRHFMFFYWSLNRRNSLQINIIGTKYKWLELSKGFNWKLDTKKFNRVKDMHYCNNQATTR